MTTEQIVAAGRTWAEREADALVGPPGDQWRSTWHDALPLVEGSYDPETEDRMDVAQAINDVAAAHWRKVVEAYRAERARKDSVRLRWQPAAEVDPEATEP